MPLEEAGTVGDPFIIESAADYDLIEANDSVGTPGFFRFEASFSYNGIPPRIGDFYGDIDMNGHTMDGITGFDLSSQFNNFFGSIYGGTFGYNITTNDGGSESVFSTFEDGAVCDDMRFEGTIQASSTGDANIFAALRGSGVSDCIFDVDISTSGSGDASIAGLGTTENIQRCIVTGQIEATGTGTAYPLSSDTDITAISYYYDSTINSGLTATDKEKAVPTTDLYDVGTYRDKNNIYYGYERQNVDATAGGNTLTYTGGGAGFTLGVFEGRDFTITSGDEIRIGNDANREVVTVDTVVSSTEITIAGTFANNHTDDVWYQFLAQDVFSIATLASYVDEDWAVEDGVAYPILGFEVVPAADYTGNFSPDSTAVQDANVYLTVSDDESFTNGETYYTTTDVNGDWTIAQTTDPTKFVRVDIDYDDAGTRKQVSFYYDPT